MEKGYIKKYWREVILRSFKAAWVKGEMRAAIISWSAIFLVIIILGLLSLFGIVPIPFFSDQVKNAFSNLLFFCGSILLLLFLFLVMLLRTPAEMNYHKNREIKKLKMKFKEPPEIEKIAKLRTEGVALRNTGEQLTDIATLPEWIESYNQWENKVLNNLGKLSKGKAEWLRTLNRMPRIHISTVSDDHAHYLDIFEEKLKRLEIIIRQYLNLQ